MVNIFKEILKQEDSLLLLVGTGALEPVIKEKVRDEGLSDKVIFLGLRDDVYDWMQAMDCFIFPSKWEGFGTVLIEAQASGLPVLSADTAPDSVKINSNFIFMSLDSSPCQWAQQACNLLESNKNVRCIDVKNSVIMMYLTQKDRRRGLPYSRTVSRANDNIRIAVERCDCLLFLLQINQEHDILDASCNDFSM